MTKVCLQYLGQKQKKTKKYKHDMSDNLLWALIQKYSAIITRFAFL